MARRPDFGKEKFFSREELEEIGRNLALMSEHAVRDFYQRAYRGWPILSRLLRKGGIPGCKRFWEGHGFSRAARSQQECGL